MTVFIQNRHEFEQRLVIMQMQEGWPIRALARHFAISRNMVRRILKRHENLRDQGHDILLHTDRWARPTKRSKKLDPFAETIKRLLEKYPRITGQRIFEELGAAGYDGGISILGSYLRTLRSDQKTAISNQILTGIDAQAYWSYAAWIGERASNCFLMVLPFSKMLFIELFPSRSLENLLTGHLHAFHYFQGIPQKIHYTLKNIVQNLPDSSTQFNRKFLDFASCHLFIPQVYNVRNLDEKGHAENDAYYVRNKFLAGRTFDSFIDCNQQAILWLDTIANVRFHRTVKARVIDLFKEKEQPHMIPLPKA